MWWTMSSWRCCRPMDCHRLSELFILSFGIFAKRRSQIFLPLGKPFFFFYFSSQVHEALNSARGKGSWGKARQGVHEALNPFNASWNPWRAHGGRNTGGGKPVARPWRRNLETTRHNILQRDLCCVGDLWKGTSWNTDSSCWFRWILSSCKCLCQRPPGMLAMLLNAPNWQAVWRQMSTVGSIAATIAG